MIPSVVSRQVRATVLDYLRTTFSLSDPQLEQALFEFLDGDRGLFRGPFLDLRLPFRKAAQGATLPIDTAPDFSPFRHQLRSWARLTSRDSTPQPTLVTTGTGSGKTECFLWPILDHCLRQKSAKGVKAILLYPMNALASDQARRLAKILDSEPFRSAGVSAGLYVGGDGSHKSAGPLHLVDDRHQLRKAPPDILLTNYKMLDFLLMRPEDQALWQHNRAGTLRYLVLDELHTYDGAQGSDVACLIRRLRARLGGDDRTTAAFCPVGTSATLGGENADDARRRLTEFATTIFGTAFDDAAVIEEDRMTAVEALGDELSDSLPMPAAADAEALDPERYEDDADWLRSQARLWLGSVPDARPLNDSKDGNPARTNPPDPKICGERLSQHVFLRSVLRASRGTVIALADLDRALGREDSEWAALPHPVREAMLDSFLGLVAWARDPDGRPFLTLQVQLWVRELRRLVAEVEPTWSPDSFFWSSEPRQAGQQSSSRRLPLAWCRDCGVGGWASYQRRGDDHLQEDVTKIGREWLTRGSGCRFVVPGAAESGETRLAKPAAGRFPERLHAESLTLRQSLGDAGSHESKLLDGEFEVCVGADVSDATPPRFLARCPMCAGTQALVMLGSRAPSLLSVGINHVFESDFNEDRKVLAFTDSVQDASHRAGFFGSRTWRFNFRTALQQVLERDGTLPLPELAQRVLPFLEQKCGGRVQAIATLVPPDLRELPEYARYMDHVAQEQPPADKTAKLERKLLAKLEDRIRFEVALEYGFWSRIGRSLELTGCSSATPAPAALERAAERLHLEVVEDNLLGSDSKRVELRTCAHFLDAILRRLRAVGGITDPMLRRYQGSGGSPVFTSKRQDPMLPPLPGGPGARRIRFLSSARPSTKQVFETYRSGKGLGWYRDFAMRCFDHELRDASSEELHSRALSALVAEGLLTETDSGSGGRSWGISSNQLLVSPMVERQTCPICHTERLVPKPPESHTEAAAVRCPTYRCQGTLTTSEAISPSYYSRRYRKGRIQRIFAHEHTGLLERAEREALENAFKTQGEPGTRADAPNLFVCTPTLEMGIDIGDLSAAVLCSIPPSASSFLQRIGRAGRTTGNAFVLTMVLEKPHDLYFYARPDALLRGHVQPPGCFLDAPEMLRRQLVAHAMDDWARQAREVRIGEHAREALRNLGQGPFPAGFLEYYEEHAEALTDRFLALFGDEVSTRNVPRLRDAGQPEAVRALFEQAFESVRAQLAEYGSITDRLRKRRSKVEAASDLTQQERDKQLEEIKDATWQVRRLRNELSERYSLNILTDAGVLPNYAFPEPGVALSLTLKREGEQTSYARTYQRPASSAIRELAPWNTFYAEGHAVRIQELDVGTTQKPLYATWRLCANCHHAEEIVPDAPRATTCPQCKDDRWADAGQARQLLRFERVRSFESSLRAAVTDASDVREEAYYSVEDFIDVRAEHCSGAQVAKEVPFGFELLTNVPLREINLGNTEDGLPSGQTAFKVADREVGVEGFTVCTGCGRVQKPGSSGRSTSRNAADDHNPWCAGRDNARYADQHRQQLMLYRELRSDALRLLLPIAEIDRDDRLQTMKAVLHFAFRVRFQGDPQHLEIRMHDEPAGGEGRRQFLVVFDRVPGGTGYLAELQQDDNLREILERAAERLRDCECQHQDPPEAACYLCLYAYQHQRHLPYIRNPLGQRMLDEILGCWGKLEPIPTLSKASLATRLERELEDKFLGVLRSFAAASENRFWSENLRLGQRIYSLRIGDERWEITRDRNVGRGQGVRQPSKPDFWMRPLSGATNRRSVAVFCDGLEYHVQPNQARSVLGEDIVKRRSLLDSGGFRVFSITWKDVTEFQDGLRDHPAAWIDKVDGRKLGALWGRAKLELDRDLHRRGSVGLLLAYLTQPDDQAWQLACGGTLAAWIVSGGTVSGTGADELRGRLATSATRFDVEAIDGVEPGYGPMARVATSRWGCLVASLLGSDLQNGSLTKGRVTIRLFDDADARASRDFESSWRQCLHAWNFVQFLPDHEVLDTETLDDLPPRGETVLPQAAESATTTGGPAVDPWSELCEQALNECRNAVERLANAVRSRSGTPLPEPGFELTNAAGAVVAEAELAWVDVRLAALTLDQMRAQKQWQDLGWRVVPIEHTEDLLTALGNT